MADKYDPYREALVMETATQWPEEYANLGWDKKSELETRLHAAPQEASCLEYVRTHTGFCRRIVVQPADIERVGGI